MLFAVWLIEVNLNFQDLKNLNFLLQIFIDFLCCRYQKLVFKTFQQLFHIHHWNWKVKTFCMNWLIHEWKKIYHFSMFLNLFDLNIFHHQQFLIFRDLFVNILTYWIFEFYLRFVFFWIKIFHHKFSILGWMELKLFRMSRRRLKELFHILHANTVEMFTIVELSQSLPLIPGTVLHGMLRRMLLI
jgi:hypothetical protein